MRLHRARAGASRVHGCSATSGGYGWFYDTPTPKSIGSVCVRATALDDSQSRLDTISAALNNIGDLWGEFGQYTSGGRLSGMPPGDAR